MPHIEEVLESVERLNGRVNTLDMRIVVGGIDFYKTLWDCLGEVSSIKEAQEKKEEYIKKLEHTISTKVRVGYTDKILQPQDRFMNWVHRINIPKKYREIVSIE